MIYRFETTTRPIQPLRLKVEINTREHFTVLGIRRRPFQVDDPWYSGQAEIGIYGIEELLWTKLRALYQRKKGRDLFDLWLALTDLMKNRPRCIPG
jgi:predicted nucleotidyltransferase component of viral defense system